MSCGCGADAEPYFDCDTSDLSRSGWVRSTRREHQCCDCFLPIPKGSRAHFLSGLYEGSFFRWYRCLDCCALSEMIATVLGYCAPWGGLLETADDLGVDRGRFRRDQMRTRQAEAEP